MKPAQRLAFGGALTAAMSATALLTAAVSALGPSLRQDLGLTRAELGLFSIAAFVTTALLSIPFGKLVDVVSGRVSMALTFGLSTTGLIAVAFAEDLLLLIVSACFGGAALAMSTSVTNSLVGIYTKQARQGRMLATKQMGVQLGQMVSGLLSPLIAVHFGWRAGIGSMAILAFLMLVLSPLAIPKPGAQKSKFFPISTEDSDPKWAYPNPRVLILLVIYAFFSGICFQGTLFGLPLVGVEEIGLKITEASLAVVVLGAVGFVSRLGWGIVADRFTRVRPIALCLGLALVIGEGFSLWAITDKAVWSYWIGAAIFGAGFALVPVMLSAAVLRLYPPAQIGFISGIVSVGTFAGFAVGPYMVGLVADTNGYPTAWTLLLASSVIAALVATLFPANQPSEAIHVESSVLNKP